jgi:hypothetical protein
LNSVKILVYNYHTEMTKIFAQICIMKKKLILNKVFKCINIFRLVLNCHTNEKTQKKTLLRISNEKKNNRRMSTLKYQTIYETI